MMRPSNTQEPVRPGQNAPAPARARHRDTASGARLSQARQPGSEGRLESNLDAAWAAKPLRLGQPRSVPDPSVTESAGQHGPSKPKRQRTAALQDASRVLARAEIRQVLECGSPLPLWLWERI